MALTTYNITGSLKDALGGSSLIGEVTFAPYGTHDARVDGADALLGPIRYALADLPDAIALSAGGWVISIRSTGRVNGDQQFKTITRTLDLTGPLTWGEIVAGAVSSPPMTPTLVEEAQAAAAEAEASAAAAATFDPALYVLKGEGGAGAGLSRVLTKLQTGESVSVTYIGDSGLNGSTATAGNDTASRVASTLGARFGVTVTTNNRAVSGYRAYSALNPGEQSPTAYASALADKADLYVIAFGHNDLRSDTTVTAALPSNGYPLAASIAAIEHMIRRIRVEVPDADVVLSNEWHYTGPSAGSNDRLVAYNAAVKRLAAAYGCGFADYHAALADLGVTGSTAATDDLYIIPTGTTGAQHPNDEGHRVWAETITDQLPADGKPVPEVPTLPRPTYGAGRYTHAAWQTLALGASDSRTHGTDGIRLITGAQWTGAAGTFPRTSTTAGSQIEVQVTGSEVSLRLDTGAGQGVVKIEANGALVNGALDLSTLSGTQSRIPLTGLGVGVHRIVVTVVSGSVTLRGVEFLPAIGQRIKYTSGLIAYTGTWADVAATQSYEGTVKSSSTLNDTVTVEWVGTALWLNGYVYGSTTWRTGVSTDGAAEVVTDKAVAGGASQHGGWLVASGLPYGRHTTTIRIDQTGRSLMVSTFLAYDETRTERPDRMAGTIVAGDPLALPTALPSTPTVRLSPADATSAVPPYPSSVTANGFTANGTAAAKLAWELTTGRIAY